MTLEGVGEVTAPRTVQSGGGITLTANTNSGFVFQDWLLNGTSRSGNPLILSNITANQSVTARWQIVTQSPQVGIGFVSATTNSLSFNTITLNAPSGALLKWEFSTNGGTTWLGANGVSPNTLNGTNTVQNLSPSTTYQVRAVLRDANDDLTLAVSATAQGTTLPAAPVITAPDISTTIYSPVSNYVIGLQNADSYSVTGLPPWLSQSEVYLSGEPTVAHIGNSSFTITAINAGGTTTKTVAVQVLWPALNADLVLTQGDYVSQVAYASSTLQAGELILQPKHGSLPNGLSLNVRRQNPITIEGGTVGDIELVGTPTQTGIFYAEYDMTVTYYEPFRQDVLPLRLRIQVVPSGGGSGFSTISAMSVMEGASGGEMSAMSNGGSGSSFIPDTLRLSAYQPNATARKVVQLLPGFSTVDANGQSRPFQTSVVGGTNAPSGSSRVFFCCIM